VNANSLQAGKQDQLLAELAAATCRVAQRQGFKAAFIDIELDLWHAYRATLDQAQPARGENSAGPSAMAS
jgi:hypothetical protein